MILYRALLHLLPSRRRAVDGDAMAAVFEELCHAERRERGWLAVGLLWMKETGGLVRFGLRERFRPRAVTAGSNPSPGRGRWDLASELKWAWRAVRARGWRAGLAVSLMAVALTATTLMFAVTDSLVLHRIPYPEAARIVEIQKVEADGKTSGDRFLSANLLDAWRQQTDLFASVQAYLSKNSFLVGDGMAERVQTMDVTPGLIELLGVAPRWGRSLTVADTQDPGLDVVVVSEGLAQRRFGQPERALGQRLETTVAPMLVVGVMPASFFFPLGGVEIWRVFDPRGPLARGFGGVMSIARMAPGLSGESLKSAMAARSTGIAETAGTRLPYAAAPAAFYVAAMVPDGEFYLLLGAAVCLLLIACANVASLELSAALPRSRTYAIQVALGASRGLLARIASLEGAVLVAVALAGAGALTLLGVNLLELYLPDRLWLRTANPINLDVRAAGALTFCAIVTWMFVSLPVVIHASRPEVLALLKAEDRTHAVSRASVFARRALTVVEVALAVVLLVGGTLYARSYQELLAVNKGFDSRNLAQLDFTIPVQYYTSAEAIALAQDVIRRLEAVPGVLGATHASAPPGLGDSPSTWRLEIDDKPPAEPIAFGNTWVDASYLEVVGLSLKRGRWLLADDPAEAVVVPEAFARRLWPDQDAVGHRFRELPHRPWTTVVGVVGDLRTGATRMPASSDRSFHVYRRWMPPPPPPSPKPGALAPPRATGASWRFLNITVRMDSARRADVVLAAARAADPRVRVTLEFVDDLYASLHADTQLALRTVSAFATLAFLTAIAGVYGVMAFLVAGRTREIGIRMALGATARDISRLVLKSSGSMVAIGTVVGVGAALLATRWTGSQFFGVTPTAPGTYILVTVVVIATSLLATWRPARAAARVDPAVTLKTE